MEPPTTRSSHRGIIPTNLPFTKGQHFRCRLRHR
jgi:hypothetical protein